MKNTRLPKLQLKKNFIFNSDGEDAVLNNFAKIQDINTNRINHRADVLLQASKGRTLEERKYRCHSYEMLSYESILLYDKNLRVLRRYKTKVAPHRSYPVLTPKIER